MKIFEYLPMKFHSPEIIRETENSTIYKAFDVLLNKDIIIKYIPKTSAFYETIFNEFKILFQFKHPNLVNVLDFGNIDKMGLYYVMPFYKKIDPIEYGKKEGVVFFLEVFFQLLCGLHFLHQRKKIHGDLSLNNVIISKEGKKIRVRITDFGMTSLSERKKKYGISGTPSYIAPELMADSHALISSKTDFYSLGVILFKLIYGIFPEEHKKKIKLIESKTNDNHTESGELFDLDDGIKKIVFKLLSNQPELRYNNNREILSDLMPYLEKYKIKKKKESLMWKNVLKEIRKNKQIELNFYRGKIIKELIDKIQKDFLPDSKFNISAIIANNSMSIDLMMNYIYYEAKSREFPIVLTDNINENEDIEEYLFNQILMNISGKYKNSNAKNLSTLLDILPYEYLILVFKDCKIIEKKRNELFKLTKKYHKLKLLFGITNECYLNKITSGAKIRYHKVKKLSNSEVREYLRMYFGYNVLPEELENQLLMNCNRDIKILNEFIDYYINNDIILYRNLKWYFRMELFDKRMIPDRIKEEIFKRLSKLDKDVMQILGIIAYWKNHFTAKEIVTISKSSTLRIDIKLMTLKEHQCVIQGKKFHSLYFPFLKYLIMDYLPEEMAQNAFQLIIEYINKQDKIDLDEKIILFDIYEKLKSYKNLLLIVESIFDKCESKDTILYIGEKVIDIYEELKTINLDKTLSILIKYTWALADRSQNNKIEEIYYFIKTEITKLSDKEIQRSYFVLNLYYLISHNMCDKVIKIISDSYNQLDNFNILNRIRILKFLATAYNSKSLFKKEKKVLHQIITLANYDTKQAVINEKIEATINLAKMEMDSTNYKNAYKMLNSLITKSKVNKNNRQTVEIFSYMALFSLKMLKLAQALKHINQAESYLKKIKQHTNSSLLWKIKGDYYSFTGNYWMALVNYNKSSVEYKNNGGYSLFIEIQKFMLLLKLGFNEQALKFIENIPKKFIQTKDDIDNIEILKYYSRYLLTDKFVEYKDIIDILKSKYLLPLNYYYSHFNNLKANKQEDTITKISELLESPVYYNNIKNKSKYYFIKVIFYLVLKDTKKALEALNNLLETLSSVIDYFEETNYWAYILKKEAFQKNIIVEDYKKYLKKARLIVQKKFDSLPNEHLKSVFLKKPIIAGIILDYKQEFAGKIDYAQSNDFLETIEEMTKIISKLTDRQKLFTEILKLALKVTKAERGIIFTINKENNQLEEEYSFQLNKKSLADIAAYSDVVIKKVLEDKRAVYQTNVNSDSYLPTYQSIVNMKIESVICLPLIIHNNVIGIVYLDSKNLISFTPEEIKFLNIFAHIAGSALETSEIYSSLKYEKEQLSNLINTSDKFVELGIIGKSPKFMETLKKIDQISKTDVNVLIEGESGTGKELMAKAIYKMSNRKEKKFIPVDCGSLSEDIIESELFGHIKGAFTGAVNDKKGLFEEANGGTIFLDEISNISLRMQAKLLRVIQEGEIKRIGENNLRQVDVRIIAASNTDLKEMVKDGKFREDLYFRLSTFPIHIPPLRERKSDINMLTLAFVNSFAKRYNKQISNVSSDALDIILDYSWPGNVRELKNELERAVILYQGSQKAIPASYFRHLTNNHSEGDDIGDMEYFENFTAAVNKYKRQLIEKTYIKSGKNWTETAKALGISRQNLNQIYKRIKKK